MRPVACPDARTPEAEPHRPGVGLASNPPHAPTPLRVEGRPPAETVPVLEGVHQPGKEGSPRPDRPERTLADLRRLGIGQPGVPELWRVRQSAPAGYGTDRPAPGGSR